MRPTTPRGRARLRLSTLAAGGTLALVAGTMAVGAASSASAAPHTVRATSAKKATPRTVAASRATSAATAIDLPSGLAMDKGNLWVTNKGNNSLTEISVSGRKVLQHLSASSYGFSSPSAIIGGGNNLWVTNEGNNSVDVIQASTGTLLKHLSASTFGFNKPIALTFDGPNVFVVNNGGSVTEIGRYRFGLIQRVTGSKYDFSDPVAITTNGSSLWVADETAGTQGAVTEFSAQTGGLQAVVKGTTANGLNQPAGVVYAGGYVWVADEAGDGDIPNTDYPAYEDTQITASTATVTDTFGDGQSDAYGFDAPTAETAAAGKVYVLDPPTNTPMVTQFDDNSTATANFFECNNNSPTPEFSEPDALTVDGNDVFVASTTPVDSYDLGGPGNMISEFSLTGGNNNGAGATGWIQNSSGSTITWGTTPPAL